MAEVKVTIKAGAGYSDPWITIEGRDKLTDKNGEAVLVSAAEDVSDALNELRTMGAFSAVKLISQEFAGAPAAGVESVKASFTDARVISDEPIPAAAPSQAPPEQSYPPCTRCGAPTKPRSGTGGNGTPFSGFACTKVRTHFDLTKS